MIMKQDCQAIKEKLKKARRILILPHIDPDPDALGSSYALASALSKEGKQCHIGLQESLDKKYLELYPDISFFIWKEVSSNGNLNYDLIFTVDLGHQERVGKYLSLLSREIPVINLDHHVDNSGFGDINIVDAECSSTSELICEVLERLELLIDKQIAVALYTGIVYDTGSFRYSLTSPRTHQRVAQLLEWKFDTNWVYQLLFENWTKESLCLRNNVFNTMESFCDGKMVVSHLKQSLFELCQAEESDMRSFVSFGMSLKGVEFSIHMNEKAEDLVSFSLRSKRNFKVNELAHRYGGGGHAKASGFLFRKSLDLALKEVYNEIVPLYEEFIRGGS